MRRAILALGMSALAIPTGGILVSCGGGDGGEPTVHIPDHPTYYEHVAPILARSCAGCHTEGGIAPFPLDSYDAARAEAAPVKAATAGHIMPPLGVDTTGACNKFDDPRIISSDEIATIGRWVDQGTIAGDPAKEPEVHTQKPTLETVSSTLDPNVMYQPNTSIADDYHCFILDPGVATDKFLTAYEVHPGERSEVHHVVLYSIDAASEEQAAQTLDANEAGPGYTCFGGSGTGGGRTLAVWAPGTGATFYPSGTGLRMHGGQKVVMQVHYNHPTKPDRTTIDLTLTDTVPHEAIITGAVDINLNLQPGQAKVVESLTAAVPATAVPYKIWGVYPHMHTLGRSMHVSLTHGVFDQCIIDVPRYDFNWQQFYFYDAPLVMPASAIDSLTISCTYDTRSASGTVTWGEGTGDEMCIAGLYVTL